MSTAIYLLTTGSTHIGEINLHIEISTIRIPEPSVLVDQESNQILLSDISIERSGGEFSIDYLTTISFGLDETEIYTRWKWTVRHF